MELTDKEKNVLKGLFEIHRDIHTTCEHHSTEDIEMYRLDMIEVELVRLKLGVDLPLHECMTNDERR